MSVIRRRFMVGIISAALIFSVCGCGAKEAVSDVDPYEQTQEESDLTTQDLSDAVLAESEETQTQESQAEEVAIDEPQVHVQWAEDVELLTDYDEYIISSSSEAQSRVAFTTDSSVENFAVLELTLVDVSESGNMEFDAYLAASQITGLDPDRPLVIGLTFKGDIPCYGFQYDDANGECRRFAMEISGEDGSILVREASREYYNFVLESND